MFTHCRAPKAARGTLITLRTDEEMGRVFVTPSAVERWIKTCAPVVTPPIGDEYIVIDGDSVEIRCDHGGGTARMALAPDEWSWRS